MNDISADIGLKRFNENANLLLFRKIA